MGKDTHFLIETKALLVSSLGLSLLVQPQPGVETPKLALRTVAQAGKSSVFGSNTHPKNNKAAPSLFLLSQLDLIILVTQFRYTLQGVERGEI